MVAHDKKQVTIFITRSWTYPYWSWPLQRLYLVCQENLRRNCEICLRKPQ